jgi:hypothetical protein
MTPAGEANRNWTMRRIKLEPALQKGGAREGGSLGYEFVAPLDPTGHISVEGWRKERALCFVHKIEDGAIAERGVLAHLPGGADGATWAFDYDPTQEGDEEAGYRFGAHAFRPGEYVSLREADGDVRTYRIASVTPA